MQKRRSTSRTFQRVGGFYTVWIAGELQLKWLKSNAIKCGEKHSMKKRQTGGDSWTPFANCLQSWLTNLRARLLIDMFDNFYDHVVKRIRGTQEVRRLISQQGDDFDQHIGNQILERGQRSCETEFLALLYAYRYAPMHHAALRSVMPETFSNALIDFGGGPGTAMLALSGSRGTSFERLSLELAQGMRAIASEASRMAGSNCKRNSEHAFPESRFWEEALQMSARRKVLLVFSYFFAQDLTSHFIRALANRIAALTPSEMIIVYTNPVGPSASWMPRGDVHWWYKELTKHLGHQSRIKTKSYSYKVLRNLAEPVTRTGDCAYEVWKVR